MPELATKPKKFPVDQVQLSHHIVEYTTEQERFSSL